MLHCWQVRSEGIQLLRAFYSLSEKLKRPKLRKKFD